MLVVAQEESFSAAALIAAHHVDTNLLASAVAFGALIHICPETDTPNKINQITSRQNKCNTDNCLSEGCLRSNHHLFNGLVAVNHKIKRRWWEHTNILYQLLSTITYKVINSASERVVRLWIISRNYNILYHCLLLPFWYKH